MDPKDLGLPDLNPADELAKHLVATASEEEVDVFLSDRDEEPIEKALESDPNDLEDILSAFS